VGKTIVITGAGAGLGRALARRFASEGETLVLLGRTLSKVQVLAEELGPQHLAVACDVGSPDSVRAAFATIAERFPTIDVLINNAATYEPFKVVNATDQQISGIIETNLSGPIYCCRSAIPMMARGAQIINVSSESVDVPFAMLSLYQSSKAGLERFSQALGAELEEDGIRVTSAASPTASTCAPGPSPTATTSPACSGRSSTCRLTSSFPTSRSAPASPDPSSCDAKRQGPDHDHTS
jgi:meso-butanediol dehydrogenase/(S,S)-butanediol dehydrogenase/diacetyl reductase